MPGQAVKGDRNSILGYKAGLFRFTRITCAVFKCTFIRSNESMKKVHLSVRGEISRISIYASPE